MHAATLNVKPHMENLSGRGHGFRGGQFWYCKNHSSDSYIMRTAASLGVY